MRTRRTLVLSLCLFLVISTLAAAQVYTVTDLGPLAPTGINAWAQVAGNYNNQAYIWTLGRMRSLGTLPGGTFSEAAGINDLGAVVGSADGQGTVFSNRPGWESVECSSGLVQPFIWTSKIGMQGLGTALLPYPLPSYDCTFAFHGRAINNSSQMVGDVPVSWDLYAYAFLWTKTNGITLFGDSWPPTFANGISYSGKIVGQDSNESEGTLGVGHATAWNNGVETDLGTLVMGGQDVGSSANGVNDLGLIVGWSTTGPLTSWGVDSPVHAVLWTANGQMRDLGTLPGDTSSAALKVNFFGQVIGSSGQTLYEYNWGGDSPFQVTGRPFVWTDQTGMLDLNTLISANSGWVLQSAADINVWGQIVGSGTRNGQTRGFLLTPRVLSSF